MNRYKGNIFRPVYIYDGISHIRGELHVTKHRLDFFPDTAVPGIRSFGLPIQEIRHVRFHKLYEIILRGVEITDTKGQTFIFILEEPHLLKKRIESLILEL